eukprot:CAMPEP_0176253308 /NCGR_PEP_ID=MMETSP0121_2-20121125/35949_1 /TAXON_ID=160619 /ORGANISM="Kryptoperidinium foliaceum, Strain CCMP 1326" /LENGTH=248 /DNA_ID=CAMNT_0017593081 /DNA_START=12 /DNA_END=755 /DNA_ORIENTATION=+
MSAGIPAEYGGGYQTFGGGVSFRPAASRPVTLAPAAAQQVHVPPGAHFVGGSFAPDLEKGAERTFLTPRNVLLVAGVLTLQLVVVPPIWDATNLLDDPAFAYFVGSSAPAWVIGACLGAVLVYAAGLASFFRFSREDSKTSQNVLRITTGVITGLGVALLFLSQPLVHDSGAASQELFATCHAGARSRSLADQYAGLRELRLQPDCMAKESVEQCEGYQKSAPGSVLKSFELDYACSGFCAAPAPPPA